MVQISSGSFFHFFPIISFVLGINSLQKLRTPTPTRDSSPFSNHQLFPDGISVTSPVDASDSKLKVNDDDDSDDDEAPRKRQRTGPNARIAISNVPVKSRDDKCIIVDGGSKKRKLPSLQNFATPAVSAVDSEDTRMTRVAISDKGPSPTTSISSCVPTDSTIIDGGSKNHSLPSPQNVATPTVLEVDSEDTRHTRVAISNTGPSPTTSISSSVQIDSTIVDGGSSKHRLPSLQNFATRTVSEVDFKDTRMARVASNTEPSPTTSISSCVQFDSSPTTSIRTTPALSQNTPVKEGKTDNSTSTHSRKRVNELSGLLVSRPLSTSTSDSSISGVLKDREEPPRKTRVLALRSANGTKSKKSQSRIADQDELELWTNADVAHVRFRKPDELNLLGKVEEESTKSNVSHIMRYLMEMEAKSSGENVARNEGAISNCVQTQVATPESFGEKRTAKAPERTKTIKNIQAVDGLEGQEDEETRDDVNSPKVPLQLLEDWSTTLRALLKGKKKFQHQVCCDPSPLSNFLNSPSGLDRPQRCSSRDLQQASKHFCYFLSCPGSL